MKTIAKVNGHKIIVSKAFNWVVMIAVHVPGRISTLANKAFGNFSYEQSISQYSFDYQVISFRQSINRTELKTLGGDLNE